MRWVVVAALVAWSGSHTTWATPPAAKLPEVLTNSIGISFKLVSAGTLALGTGKDRRELTIEQPFYLGFTEVTNAQGMALMGFVPSHFKDLRRPIESVSCHEAKAFCNRLSSLRPERIAGRVYRLPTREEWEYACRADTTTRYSFGDDASLLGDFAWYVKNSNHPQIAGGKRPNPWGLFGMHGNVAEWCSNGDGEICVRGGQWNRPEDQCGSGRIYSVPAETKRWDIGFRIAMTPPGMEKSEFSEKPKPFGSANGG